MIIDIGNNSEEKNKIRKYFNKRFSLTGNIKEPSSIIDPVILVQCDLSSISSCNYCFIPEFQRYYYITNAKSATSTTCTLHLHVDVLKSFEDAILSCTGYVDRQENEISVLISDPEKIRQVNPAISTVPFDTPAEATGFTYCLITTKAVP